MKIKIGKKIKNNNAEMRTETISDKSKFAIVESYKSARSNIMFSLSADDDKLFAVTSYSKGEGKSTVSANLAISFSKMEKKVLLVDCDLRRPNIHNIFKIENQTSIFSPRVQSLRTPPSFCAHPSSQILLRSCTRNMTISSLILRLSA